MEHGRYPPFWLAGSPVSISVHDAYVRSSRRREGVVTLARLLGVLVVEEPGGLDGIHEVEPCLFWSEQRAFGEAPEDVEDVD